MEVTSWVKVMEAKKKIKYIYIHRIKALEIKARPQKFHQDKKKKIKSLIIAKICESKILSIRRGLPGK